MENNLWLTSEDVMNRWGINEPTLAQYILDGKLRAYSLSKEGPLGPSDWRGYAEVHAKGILVKIPLVRIMRQLPNLLFRREDVLEFEEKQGLKVDTQAHFSYFVDFRNVRKNDKQFKLTTKQAGVIEVLYEAYVNQTPDVGQEHIRDRIGSAANVFRLRDVFRNNEEAYKELIVPGERKGTYRLNI